MPTFEIMDMTEITVTRYTETNEDFPVLTSKGNKTLERVSIKSNALLYDLELTPLQAKRIGECLLELVNEIEGGG